MTKSMIVGNTEQRPNSSHIRRKKQMTMTQAQNKDSDKFRYQYIGSPDRNRSSSPTSSARRACLKRRQNHAFSETFEREESPRNSPSRHQQEPKKKTERIYYRQEDIIGKDFSQHKGNKEKLHEILENNPTDSFSSGMFII